MKFSSLQHETKFSIVNPFVWFLNSQHSNTTTASIIFLRYYFSMLILTSERIDFVALHFERERGVFSVFYWFRILDLLIYHFKNF
jgi:hypothetical protein